MQLAFLAQAAAGSITRSFLKIALRPGDRVVHLVFVVERLTPVEQEAIAEIVSLFEGYQQEKIALTWSTIVGRENDPTRPSDGDRILFSMAAD